MTLEERNQVLNSSSFIAKCRIAFCDWIEYWAINGTDSIQDENLRNQTEGVIRVGLDNLDTCVSKIAVLAISDGSIVNAEEATDALVSAAVTNIMSHAIEYLM